MTSPRVWTRLDQPRFGLADRISDAIAACEWTTPGLLGDTRTGNEIVIACDIAGDHRQALYQGFGFLVAATQNSRGWLESRRRFRRTWLRDGRRMAYKSLGDRMRRRALGSFLMSASLLSGTVVVFLVSRKIKTLFSDPGDQRLLPELVVAERGWNSKSFYRLLLIGSLGSLLISCMSEARQDILWLTDEDEIAPNREKHDVAGHVIHHCIGRYSPNHRGAFVFATTEGDHDERFREDAVAIPDLAAGAIVDTFTRSVVIQQLSVKRPLWLPVTESVPEKARAILRWMAQARSPLRSVVVVLDDIDDDIRATVFRPLLVAGEIFIRAPVGT